MAQTDHASSDQATTRLAAELAAVAASELELRHELAVVHHEISDRDAELKLLAEELRRTRRQRDEAYAELAAMRRTRLWRAGATWWWLRDALRRNRVR
jgi:hypothetical protein